MLGAEFLVEGLGGGLYKISIMLAYPVQTDAKEWQCEYLIHHEPELHMRRKWSGCKVLNAASSLACLEQAVNNCLCDFTELVISVGGDDISHDVNKVPIPLNQELRSVMMQLELGNYGAAYAKACSLANSGLHLAEAIVGSLLMYGFGVDRDEFAARRWFEKAAKGNDPNGAIQLGAMYEYGKAGLQRSAEMSQHYLKIAEYFGMEIRPDAISEHHAAPPFIDTKR